MAQRFCPADDIVKIVGYTPKQFKRAVWCKYKKSIPDFVEMFAAQGRYLIQQAQFELAYKKGHAPMQRWLGIQHCGQVTKTEILNKNVGKTTKGKKETQGFKMFVPGSATVPPPTTPTTEGKKEEAVNVGEELRQEALKEEVLNVTRTLDEHGVIVEKAKEKF